MVGWDIVQTGTMMTEAEQGGGLNSTLVWKSKQHATAKDDGWGKKETNINDG